MPEGGAGMPEGGTRMLDAEAKNLDAKLTLQLKQQAQQLGFALVGVTPAVLPTRLNHFHRWLENGYAGQMLYLENRKSAYEHPSSILDGCKSLLMLGMPYLANDNQRQPAAHSDGVGKIARYAQCGLDYHDVIRGKLKQLRKWLVQNCPGANARGVVDTAPLLEREFAEAAGLGWVGKNTLLLNRTWGSYFFLAALLTNVELQYDLPQQTSHCGTCTACIDLCPTSAIVAPYVLDANRCLSYVTIESPGLPPADIAAKASGWLFGCDICQEVCPWNRRSQCTSDATWQPDPSSQSFDLMQVLSWSDSQFEANLKGKPMWRAKRRGMLRNAILLAGSQRLESASIALAEKLRDEESLVRAAAAWALGEINTESCRTTLVQAQLCELDKDVQEAIAQAVCRTATLRRG